MLHQYSFLLVYNFFQSMFSNVFLCLPGYLYIDHFLRLEDMV